MTALGLLGFNAVGSAIVVRICDWPARFWWPVFGYATLCGLLAWWAQ